MRHDTCSHAATSKARAACRRAKNDPATVQAVEKVSDAALAKAMAQTAREGIVIPHTEAVKSDWMTDADWHVLLRNRARWTDSPWPTREETAASLAKIWCTVCHLLHDLPGCPGYLSTPRQAVTRAPAPVATPDPIATRKLEASRAATDELPTFANARRLAADIPAGRYAVREPAGEIKFYQIDKPTTGRWEGYVFLKIQASDATFPIKSAARQMSVYGAILDAGVQASSELYGRTLGSCGVCGRTLTDPDSIARGIGPHCAAKMGW